MLPLGCMSQLFDSTICKFSTIVSPISQIEERFPVAVSMSKATNDKLLLFIECFWVLLLDGFLGVKEISWYIFPTDYYLYKYCMFISY